MPKYTTEAENVTAAGPKMTSDLGEPSTELSKKELGRMKSKRAVLAATAKKEQRPEDEEPENNKRARWRS